MTATLCHSVDPKALRNHHVLLCCAKDTHFGFTGQLLCALREAEFHTVFDWDRHEIERKASEESLIYIVILSKHYLSSPSGLDKLAEIVDESSEGRRMGQLLLPVLYDLELSFVRQQIYLHKNSVHPQRFTKWVQSLTRLFAVAANFTGCHFRSDGDTYEYECIKKIVQRVSKHVASRIGLNPQVMQVIQLLYSRSDDGVHVVGICEKPIIGKKTLARSVYDLIADKGFDKCCFLAAGENLREPRLVHLVDMFSSAMVGNNHIMEITKGTLKKVFIIFEGINDPKLLKFAVGLTDWFGSGSRIIVTSRDKCLLENHGVKRVYQVERCAET
ncbi:Disease resistance protein RML1A, partial [Mucuna pruriens]